MADTSNWSSASAGVFQASVFRGRELSAAATAAISALIAMNMEPEDGCLAVVDVNGVSTVAFTARGDRESPGTARRSECDIWKVAAGAEAVPLPPLFGICRHSRCDFSQPFRGKRLGATATCSRGSGGKCRGGAQHRPAAPSAGSADQEHGRYGQGRIRGLSPVAAGGATVWAAFPTSRSDREIECHRHRRWSLNPPSELS